MRKVIFRIIILVLLMFSVVQFSNMSANAKTVRKDGYYYTVIQKKSTIIYGSDLYIKKVKIKGNRITTYGSYSYGKQEWGGKTISPKKRTFKISANCTFWDDWGVPTGMSRMNKKNLYQFLKRVSLLNDTGQCLIMKVKHGKVVKMMLGQG